MISRALSVVIVFAGCATTPSSSSIAIDCTKAPRWTTAPTFVVEAFAVDAARRAAQTWRESGAPNIRVVLDVDDLDPVTIDGVNRIGSQPHFTWPYPQHAAAVTLVYQRPKSAAIYEVDIALNPAHVRNLNEIDLENLLTHEIGHALGLQDSKYPEAVMYFQVTRGDPLKPVDSSDTNALHALYACS